MGSAADVLVDAYVSRWSPQGQQQRSLGIGRKFSVRRCHKSVEISNVLLWRNCTNHAP